MLFRVSIAVYCLVLILNNEAARADLSCKYDNAATACLPDNPVSEALTDRIKQTRILFEGALCQVKEITLSGEAEAKPDSSEVRITVRYECKTPQNEPAKSGMPVREITTARYRFLCALREYKFFATGFDIFDNGKNSHWDSQGSSAEIPWQTIPASHRDTHLTPLFRLWCE
jgi:hypothetical protein